MNINIDYIYTIGSLKFRTKTEIIDHCKAIMETYKDGQIINDMFNLPFLQSIIKWDYGFRKFYPKDFVPTKIWFDTTMSMPNRKISRKLFFKDPQGATINVSFYECINNIPSEEKIPAREEIIHSRIEQSIKPLFRKCVYDIVQNYAKKFKYPTISEYSGELINSRKEAHVDHYDMCFNELVEAYMKERGYSYEYLYLYKTDFKAQYHNDIQRGVEDFWFNCKEFVDHNLIIDFREYHNTHTHLRLVTKAENLSLLKRIHNQEIKEAK